MVSTGFVMRILAAVALAIVCLAPSLSEAHVGAPVAAAAADRGTASVDTVTAVVAAAVAEAQANDQHRGHGKAGHGPPDCGCDLCTSLNCATCSGAALAPDLSSHITTGFSEPLLIDRAAALHGLPPEALPKPPRSFV